MAAHEPAPGDVSIPAEADPDQTQMVTSEAVGPSGPTPEAGQATQIVTSAPSAFDVDKTQIVNKGDLPGVAVGHGAPQPSGHSGGYPPATPQPAGPMPTPPVAQRLGPASRPGPAPQQPPYPATLPPPVGAPHQQQHYGGPTPPPHQPLFNATPPPLGAPHQSQAPNYGGPTPPPPPGAPPSGPTGYGQPPAPGGPPPNSQNTYQPYSANGAQSPMDAANALLAKGNSLIAQLMSRGIRGELIRQPWFQGFRRTPQQADQFVYISYAVGIVLTLVLGMMGAVGTILALGIGIGLCYLYFALGTKKAHQFIAYGICGVGGGLSVLSLILSAVALMDVMSLRYATGSMAVGLIINIGVTVVVGAILGYIGLQVLRGIRRLERR